MPNYDHKLEDQRIKIESYVGEIQALILASRYINGRIRSLTSSLRTMRDVEARLKVQKKAKESLSDYKEKVSQLKKRISDDKERKLREELNDLELKGKI